MNQPHPPNPYRQAIEDEISFLESLADNRQSSFDSGEDEQLLGRVIDLVDKIRLIEDSVAQMQFFNRLHGFVLSGSMSLQSGPIAEAKLVRAMLETPIDLTFDFRAWLNRRLAYALGQNRSLEIHAGEAEARLKTADGFDPPKTAVQPVSKSSINWKALALDIVLGYVGRRRKPRR